MKGSQNPLQSGRDGGYERVRNFGTNDNAKHIMACTLLSNWTRTTAILLFWLILESRYLRGFKENYYIKG